MLKLFAVVLRCVALSVLLLVLGGKPDVRAQVPLFLVNEETTVKRIGFAFTSTRTFEDKMLLQQIATQGPGFWDRVNFLSSTVYPLDRIELQKDVVRLRRFYRENGFLAPHIDYGTSRLDSTKNAIRIVFEIDEGPPVIIQDVGFFSPQGGYATRLFTGTMRARWIDFRDRTRFKTGDRFTYFDLIRIQDQVLSWLKDRGYAFATLDTDVTIDSTYYTADIHFNVAPGPRGYIDTIDIEGNDKIASAVIRRELPFKQDDVFSHSKLIQGQRELFGLNLFRVALVDVPSQPIDSTVAVRFTVREAKLHYLTGQTGYSEEAGVTLGGQWAHRNFLGGGRNLTFGIILDTGYLSSPPPNTPLTRRFRGSIALRQPYLFSNHLSAILEPFIEFKSDPLLEKSTQFLNINRQEEGVETTLFYEILPFRPMSLDYTLSRAHTFTEDDAGRTNTDIYGKSELTGKATLGRVNNFLNPQRGFLVRPSATYAGGLFHDVEYFKVRAEVVAYIPLTRVISLGTRLSGGRLWPLGQSTNQFASPFEDRFDPIHFQIGGSNDVRGWNAGLIGPKENRTRFVEENEDIKFGKDGLPETEEEEYEPIGGLAMLVGNVEARLRFPWLGPLWRIAVFLDVGQISGERDPTQDCITEAPILQEIQCGFKDEGRLRLNAFKVGVGAGIRYQTPIGYIRIDLAYKVNPDDQDLLTPRDDFLLNIHWDGKPSDFSVERPFLRRFNLHLSLGQAF